MKALAGLPIGGLVAATTVAVTLFASGAHGAAITVTDPGAGGAFNGTIFSLGWQFTTNQDITVTDLGIYDAGAGLVDQADIGIFTNAGDLLASASLAAGNGAPLVDGFRYGSVAPTALSAGMTYVIASYYTGGYYNFNSILNPVFAVDPAINFDAIARLEFASSLVFPSESRVSDRAYIGPNFQFTAAIPEPAALGLLGLGLIGLALVARRRRDD